MEILKNKECGIPLPREIDFLIYHKNCGDGFAAYVVTRMFMEKHNLFENRLKVFALDYKDLHDDDEDESKPKKKSPLPDVKGCNVLVADLSLSIEHIRELKKNANKFLLIDHHDKSAEDLLDEELCIIDTRYCGATLAWFYFFGDEPYPLPLKYIQDRDTWEWTQPLSREVSLAQFVTFNTNHNDDENYKKWMEYLKDPSVLERFKQEGVQMKRLQDKVVIPRAKWAKKYKMFGYTVVFAEAPQFASDTAESMLLQHPDAHFAITWEMNEIDDSWRNIKEAKDSKNKKESKDAEQEEKEYKLILSYHLRSRKHDPNAPDVNEIARRLDPKKKSGGHKNASGFKMSGKLPAHHIFEIAKEIYAKEKADEIAAMEASFSETLTSDVDPDAKIPEAKVEPKLRKEKKRGRK